MIRQRKPYPTTITRDNLLEFLAHTNLVEGMVMQARWGDVPWRDDTISEVWMEICEIDSAKLVAIGEQGESQFTGYISGLVARSLCKNGAVNRRIESYRKEVAYGDLVMLEEIIERNNNNGKK